MKCMINCNGKEGNWKTLERQNFSLPIYILVHIYQCAFMYCFYV